MTPVLKTVLLLLLVVVSASWGTTDGPHFRRIYWGNTTFLVPDSQAVHDLVAGIDGAQFATSVFKQVLTGDQRQGAVIDVGSNTGIYGLYAAVLGYQTLLFEVQPRCVEQIKAALAINQVDRNTKVYDVVLGRNSMTRVNVSEQTRCTGESRTSLSSQFEGMNRAMGIDPQSYYGTTTRSFTAIFMGQLGPHDVSLRGVIRFMKITVLGYEAEVVGGVWELLELHAIDHLLVELCPALWHEYGFNNLAVVEELSRLWDYGYTRIRRYDSTSGATIVLHSKEEFKDALRPHLITRSYFHFSHTRSY